VWKENDHMKQVSKALLLLAPAAGLGVMAFAAQPAGAATQSTSYQATLSPLNHVNGSGDVTIRLSGDQATISEHFSGLAATFGGNPYPHVQHIHGGADGQCPTTSADKNGDGRHQYDRGPAGLRPDLDHAVHQRGHQPEGWNVAAGGAERGKYDLPPDHHPGFEDDAVVDEWHGGRRGAWSGPVDIEQEGAG
jgi:hypothetical protein